MWQIFLSDGPKSAIVCSGHTARVLRDTLENLICGEPIEGGEWKGVRLQDPMSLQKKIFLSIPNTDHNSDSILCFSPLCVSVKESANPLHYLLGISSQRARYPHPGFVPLDPALKSDSIRSPTLIPTLTVA